MDGNIINGVENKSSFVFITDFIYLFLIEKKSISFNTISVISFLIYLIDFNIFV